MEEKKKTKPTWYTKPTSRGVDYSPTWPTWVVGAGGTQTGDSDFANDAFQSLWGNAYTAAPSPDTSVPVNNGTNYRNDLGTISSFGFNLVRLYNWDMARGTTATSNTGLDHINFLNYANTNALKVVVPVSDYFLNDDQFSWKKKVLTDYEFISAPAAIQNDFNQFIASITDPSTGKIHTAIHSISVGNEGDIGQGLTVKEKDGSFYTTTASDFLDRTIWWIVNLHKTINGSSSVNGTSPIVRLSATFSNGDQGGTTGSWFNSLVSGVAAGTTTPNGCTLGSTFATKVTGLSAADSSYTDYYYNSVNISQVTMMSPYNNSLAATLAQYDSGDASWPCAKFNVPLLFMEVFTENRTAFSPTTGQATAAIAQITAMENYLKANNAGTSSSTTNFMGYCYFEFNDEQTVKLSGLYGYGTPSVSANTGTTSVFYSPYSFPTVPFPVYPLVATPGPTGTSGSLIAAIQALFPTT